MAITIRGCTDGDVAGVVALIADRIGAEDAPESELVLGDPRYDRKRWTVAVDGDRVVSTMGTYPMTVRFGISEVPAALIEFVATEEEYEGQGLVRRQFDYHHTDLAARGELLEVMVGITYFYRKLGYEYALPVSGWRAIPSGEIPTMPAGWSVRAASEADIDTILQMQRQAAASADVAVALSEQMWTFLLRSPVYQTLIGEHHGVPAACGRIYLDDGEPFLMDLAGSERAGLDAVLAGVVAVAPEQPITNLIRPVMPVDLDDLGAVEAAGDAYYTRIGDPVRWLNAVRPELSRRLAASALAGQTGEGLISLYGSSISFSYSDGAVGEFAVGPRVQAPISRGGSGVPPDLVTSLLVGPLGFSGLAARHPDVNAGRQAELMDVLFPPLDIDVQSWVIP